ncbi:MAG TPA: hypothetical protein VIV11_01990 [Kofleriaceae bacterium]
MGRRLALCVAILAACGDNIEPPPDDDSVVIIALETHAPAQVAAGDMINVSCTLLENDIESMVTGEITVAAETSVIRMGTAIIARTVGTVEVACVLPGRGIKDITPATVQIVAGAAANIVTTIVPDPVVAGNSITTTCEVYDAYGNEVTGTMPTLQLSPDDSANPITNLNALMTRAGHYTGRCYLPGTTSNNAPFDVVPNLPASLLISKFPDLPVYAIGNSVLVTALVTDRYGNEITPAPVTMASAPITGVGPTVVLGPHEWRYNGEGLYRITVSVTPPTDNNVALTQTTDVIVNSRGPAITCANDATMVNLTPGSALTVNGQATDVNGVSSVTVNGNAVTLGANGTFSTSITTRFGHNFVDITALDAFGEPTTKLCTFLVSNRYFNPANTIADTVSLKLTQPACDDMNRSGQINSLGDVLHTVVNSSGLKTEVHNALLNSNPLKPFACDSQTCTFLGCICWYRTGVTYLDSRFPGPNTVSLTLVDGGIRAVARMENIGVNLRVRYEGAGLISGTTDGWVNVSHIEVTLILNTALSGGSPNVTVRSGSVSTSVGSISTQFSGVDGWIINNIVVPLAQGSLRDTLRNLIQNFVTNNFNAVLDGLLGNLDISTLGSTFNVPRLDGSGNVALGFAVAFSSLNTTPARMLFGIGTRLTGPTANAFPTLGVPTTPGTILLDPTVTAPANTGVGAYAAIFNHALHALWRANYFAVTLNGTQLGNGVPASVTLSIVTRLPPVATILSNGTVQLQLGAMDLIISHPDLPQNLSVRVGADAHSTVTLVGNDLTFGGIVVDQVHVGTDDVNLGAQQQQSLQQALGAVVQQLVNQSLNNALPAIPIPTFTIPASLGAFGLPVGRELGINSPVLTVAPQHFTLRGQFGLRP